MFKRYFIVLFSLILSYGSISGQDSEKSVAVENLYLSVSLKDSAFVKNEYGKLVLTDDFKCKISAIDNENAKEKLVADLPEILKNLPPEKQNILFYIHGMYAHAPQFVRLHAQKLHKHVYSKESNPYGVVITLVWEGGNNYKKNIPNCLMIGNHFSDVVMDVIDIGRAINPQIKISSVNHSMGNRVFQGIVESFESRYDTPPYEKIVCCAADLESDIFESSQPLADIDKIGKNTVVYVHNTDRVLMVTQKFTNLDRLGLNGINDYNKIPESVKVVDVSTVADNEDLASFISNHRYFYMSPTVRTDLYHVLSDNESALNSSRKVLDHKNRLLLKYHGE